MSKDVERDVSKGFSFLTKSCEMNNATACFYLSGMHISGVQKQIDEKPTAPPTKEDFVIQKDMKKAFDFAYKACDLKNMFACANLSQMYARGEGTEKSEESAEKFKKIALEMQDDLKTQHTQLGFQQGATMPQ